MAAAARSPLTWRRPLTWHLLLLLCLLAPPPGASAAEDLAGRCAAFEVENKHCCHHALLICHNICYNGSNLLYPSLPDAPLCSDPEPGTAADNGLLRPIPCRPPAGADVNVRKEFEFALDRTISESRLGPLDRRPPSWLAARAAVRWMDETTYLQVLGKSESNVAHFIGKMNTMLLLNNATSPALLPPVTRIMLPRQQSFLQSIADSGAPLQYYSSVMRYLSYAALRGVLPTPVLPAGLDAHPEFSFPIAGPTDDAAADVGRRRFAFGHLEFEGALEGATEARPLCWRRVILPGMMKAIAYVGGPPAARVFKDILAEGLGLPPQPLRGSSSPVKLLYLKRTGVVTGGRRLLVPESLELLRGIFSRLGFEVTEAEFAGRTFKEQYSLVRDADVIVSLHSAALTNACMFAREGTAVVEILPYRFYFEMFRYMALSSGATYFRHQCTAGAENSTWRQLAANRDALFRTFSRKQCVSTWACTKYFLQHRAVEFGPADVASLEALLAHTKDLALWRRGGPEEASEKMRGKFRAACLPKPSTDPWSNCRQNVISSPDVDPLKACVVEEDCSEWGAESS